VLFGWVRRGERETAGMAGAVHLPCTKPQNAATARGWSKGRRDVRAAAAAAAAAKTTHRQADATYPESAVPTNPAKKHDRRLVERSAIMTHECMKIARK